jgi:hypothetical protein
LLPKTDFIAFFDPTKPELNEKPDNERPQSDGKQGKQQD